MPYYGASRDSGKVVRVQERVLVNKAISLLHDSTSDIITKSHETKVGNRRYNTPVQPSSHQCLTLIDCELQPLGGNGAF